MNASDFIISDRQLEDLYQGLFKLLVHQGLSPVFIIGAEEKLKEFESLIQQSGQFVLGPAAWNERGRLMSIQQHIALKRRVRPVRVIL